MELKGYFGLGEFDILHSNKSFLVRVRTASSAQVMDVYGIKKELNVTALKPLNIDFTS